MSARIIPLFPAEPPVDRDQTLADALRLYQQLQEDVRPWSDSTLIAVLCDRYALPSTREAIIAELAARGPRKTRVQPAGARLETP